MEKWKNEKMKKANTKKNESLCVYACAGIVGLCDVESSTMSLLETLESMVPKSIFSPVYRQV